MPNWTYNTISCSKSILEQFIDDDGNFDFGKIFPMPEELQRTVAGGFVDEMMALYLIETETKIEFFRKVKEYHLLIHAKPSETKKAIRQRLLDRLDGRREEPEYNPEMGINYHYTGEFYCQLKERLGYKDWYSWSLDHWGTKWNACDSEYDADQVHFDTAWSAPLPIFEELCRRFPDEEIQFAAEYEEGFYSEWENKNGRLIQTISAELYWIGDEDFKEKAEAEESLGICITDEEWQNREITPEIMRSETVSA